MSHTLTYVCVQKCICEGVYTGFMLICMCGYVCMYVRRSVTSSIFCPSELELTRLLCPWDPPDRNTGVGSHSHLQGIFPTQGLNPGLLYYRQILYQLSHQGSHNQTLWLSNSPVNCSVEKCPHGMKDISRIFKEVLFTIAPNLEQLKCINKSEMEK